MSATRAEKSLRRVRGHLTDRNVHNEVWPLGVVACADEGLGVQLEAVRKLRVPTVHLQAPHDVGQLDKSADSLKARLDKAGAEVTVLFAGFDGESYEDIATVKETVGLTPVATRLDRTRRLLGLITLAEWLGAKAIGLHLGFLSCDFGDEGFATLVEGVRSICSYAGDRGVDMHLETGQEPAADFLRFIRAVDQPNLFVNFDPANMILYGSGEPIDAARQLGTYIRSVHFKDATWSSRPGETWGEETPFGDGAVDFPALLNVLGQIGYAGPLTIEREILGQPERQMAEVAQAVKRITALKAAYTPSDPQLG